jgi:hypothetical protein
MSDLPFSFLLQVSLAEIICMDSMKPVIDFFCQYRTFLSCRDGGRKRFPCFFIDMNNSSPADDVGIFLSPYR